MDVTKGPEAEGRDAVVDRVPQALLHGFVGFAPVALDRVDLARLNVEVDDVRGHAAVGQQGIGTFEVEVAMGFTDCVALALQRQVEALGAGDGLGDFVGVEGFLGVVLVGLDEGAGVDEAPHLARRQLHDLDVFVGILEMGSRRVDVEVLGVDNGRLGRVGQGVPASLADADAHEANAEQIAFEVRVEAGHLIDELVVHVGLDAGSRLFTGRVGVA